MVEVIKHQLIKLRCYCVEDIAKLQYAIYHQLSVLHASNTDSDTLRNAFLETREGIYLGLEVCKLHGRQV